MNKKERINKAQDIMLDEIGADYIVSTHEAKEFVECVISIGGDIYTYRVYDNGDVFSK